MAQSGKCPTPGFVSGHNLTICEIEPRIRGQSRARLGFSLPLSAPCLLACSLSPKTNKLKKKKKKKRLRDFKQLVQSGAARSDKYKMSADLRLRSPRSRPPYAQPTSLSFPLSTCLKASFYPDLASLECYRIRETGLNLCPCLALLCQAWP